MRNPFARALLSQCGALASFRIVQINDEFIPQLITKKLRGTAAQAALAAHICPARKAKDFSAQTIAKPENTVLDTRI